MFLVRAYGMANEGVVLVGVTSAPWLNADTNVPVPMTLAMARDAITLVDRRHVGDGGDGTTIRSGFGIMVFELTMRESCSFDTGRGKREVDS